MGFGKKWEVSARILPLLRVSKKISGESFSSSKFPFYLFRIHFFNFQLFFFNFVLVIWYRNSFFWISSRFPIVQIALLCLSWFSDGHTVIFVRWRNDQGTRFYIVVSLKSKLPLIPEKLGPFLFVLIKSVTLTGGLNGGCPSPFFPLCAYYV